MGVLCPRNEWNGELEADVIEPFGPPLLGVPKGVLPAENTIVSLTDESAVFDLLDPLLLAKRP